MSPAGPARCDILPPAMNDLPLELRSSRRLTDDDAVAFLLVRQYLALEIRQPLQTKLYASHRDVVPIQNQKSPLGEDTEPNASSFRAFSADKAIGHP